VWTAHEFEAESMEEARRMAVEHLKRTGVLRAYLVANVGEWLDLKGVSER
jgi:hypothetical protein